MVYEHQGYRHHVRFSDAEASWGTKPSPATWNDWPWSELSLAMKPTLFEPKDNASGWQTPRQLMTQKVVSGGISGHIYPVLAENLLNWILERDSYGDLYSRTVQSRNPLEQRQFVGCKVNTATIKGDHGGDVSVALEVIGRNDEAAADFTSDPTYTTDVPFKFQDAVLELPDGAELSCESFEIKVDNKLIVGPYYGDSLLIAYLCSGRQEVTGSVKAVFNATTHLTALRAGTKGSLEIVLTHPTQATDGLITLAIDKLAYPEVPLDRSVDGVVSQTINFKAEIPDSGNQLTAVIANVT